MRCFSGLAFWLISLGSPEVTEAINAAATATIEGRDEVQAAQYPRFVGELLCEAPESHTSLCPHTDQLFRQR
jgi:hypothetical protein